VCQANLQIFDNPYSKSTTNDRTASSFSPTNCNGDIFLLYFRQALSVGNLISLNFDRALTNFLPIMLGECIYIKQWHERERAAAALRPTTSASTTSPVPDKRVSAGGKQITDTDSSTRNGRLSVQDDAKLIFGVVFSLRNMVRKLSTPLVTHSPMETIISRILEADGIFHRDDNFISYRTNNYKLHYYETPTNLKFVMITDMKTNNLRVVLHQIYVNLYVEYGM